MAHLSIQDQTKSETVLWIQLVAIALVSGVGALLTFSLTAAFTVFFWEGHGTGWRILGLMLAFCFATAGLGILQEMYVDITSHLKLLRSSRQ